MKKFLGRVLLLIIVCGSLWGTAGYTKESNIADEVSDIFMSDPVTINTRTISSVAGDGAQIIGVDNKIYCFGTDSTLIYDITNEDWTAVSAMSAARTDFGLAEVNGIIYIIGGRSENGNESTKRVDTFNTNGNTWGTAADIPYPLISSDAVVIDNNIYCDCGKYVYNTVSNSWTSNNPWTSSNYSLSLETSYTGSALGNKIYYTSKDLSCGNKTYELNTADLSWRECQPRPNYVVDGPNTGQYKLVTVDDILLCIEYGGDNELSSKVRYAYIPDEDVWVILPDKLPELEINNQAFTLYNEKIFVLTSGVYSDGLTKSRLAATTFLKNERMYSSRDTIVAGNRHILNYSGGVLMAKGDNTYGQLGDGTNNSSDLFVEVQAPWEENGETVRSIGADGNMSYVITDKYNLYVWGRNDSSQLGVGSTDNLNTPTFVTDNVLKVAGGESHTIILKRDASVWTSGNNSYGQLGNNSTSTKRRFDRVAENAVDIQAGKYQSYIINSDGTLKGCGSNTSGALGIGSAGSIVKTFTDVMTNVKSVSSGNAHSIAVDDSGNMYVWGSNAYGQLGLPDNIKYQNVPYKVEGVKNPTIAKAGGYVSVYVTDDGAYQTGLMGVNNEYEFKRVDNIYDIFELDAGEIVVAKTYNNEIYRWGVNTYSQNFQIKSNKITDKPAKLAELSVKTLDSKRTQTLATDLQDKVLEWGTGYFGTGSEYEETYTYPINIKDQEGYLLTGQVVERGKNHNLVVNWDSEVTKVYGWGSNSNFPMGRSLGGDPAARKDVYTGIKVTLPTLTAFTSNLLTDGDGDNTIDHNACVIAAGAEFSLGVFKEYINSTGDIAFDDYYLYAMGKGYTNNSSVTDDQIEVRKANYDYMDAGYGFTVAIGEATEGEEKGQRVTTLWGDNEYGQLANGRSNDVSEIFDGYRDEHFTEVKAGPYFCIGVTNKGNVYSWGKNSMGQLGLGYTSEVEAPQKINGLSNVVSVGVGHDHAMAVKADGTVWTWGNNSKNQLGRVLGMTTKPGQVMGITNAKQVVGGYEYTVVVDDDNQVWTFGSDEYGALGMYRSEPIAVYSGIGDEY